MGLLTAIFIILLWGSHLTYLLFWFQPESANVMTYLHILIQGYLYTGLFITAHDAMHGTVSSNKYINNTIGWMATVLFAGMMYNRLLRNHKLHHSFPGTEKDPDFYVKSQNFFIWWGSFLFRYTTISQLIVMGIAYNILNIYTSELNLWLYWIIPAFSGTFQLFYFGTYLPHKRPHSHDMEPHKARTQNKNHVWAMLSCYFFGYHSEHHNSPKTPWWQLYKMK